jgi:hypothetical protein
VAITLIYIKSENAGDSVPNFSSKKLAPPLPSGGTSKLVYNSPEY